MTPLPSRSTVGALISFWVTANLVRLQTKWSHKMPRAPKDTTVSHRGGRLSSAASNLQICRSKLCSSAMAWAAAGIGTFSTSFPRFSPYVIRMASYLSLSLGIVSSTDSGRRWSGAGCSVIGVGGTYTVAFSWWGCGVVRLGNERSQPAREVADGNSTRGQHVEQCLVDPQELFDFAI